MMGHNVVFVVYRYGRTVLIHMRLSMIQQQNNAEQHPMRAPSVMLPDSGLSSSFITYLESERRAG